MVEGDIQSGGLPGADSRNALRFGGLQCLGLLAVLVVAFLLRCEGIHWPKLMHPDEQVIVKWGRSHGPNRVYASGFFVMYRTVQQVRASVRSGVERFHRHTGESAARTGPDLFLLVRWFNVWLGTLACLPVFLFARRVTGSGWAGVLAAALMAGAHYPVEHSHYAETDVAMLFTLALALWLWAVAVDTDRRRWLAAAGMAAGFAAGTKFILLALVPPFLAYAAIQFRQPSRRAGRWVGFLGLALLAVGLGFWLANPWLSETKDLWGRLAVARDKLATETTRNMGALAGDSRVLWFSNAAWFGRFARSLGWGWLLLCLLSVPLLWRPAYRRFACMLAGFPALLFLAWVFAFPWVRSQEFMAFLPGLAVAAVLPVLWLYRSRVPAARPAAWLAAGLALGMGTIEGMRAASVFGWADTRIVADRWLDRHEPPDMLCMEERYAGGRNWQGTVRNRRADVWMAFREQKVEADNFGADVLRGRGVGYVIRNHSYESRGMVNPLTGSLFPDYRQRRLAFDQNSEALISWSMVLFPSSFVRSRTSSGFTLANSTDIGLYGLRVSPREPDFAVSLARPVRISTEGRETFVPSGRELGSDTAIQVDRGVREFAIGGREAEMDPVWLVCHTRERSATLAVSGYGRTKEIRLAPYDARVLALHRPFWLPRVRHWEIVRVRAVPDRDSIGCIPCFVRVAFSAEDVFRCLRDIGIGDRFESLWPGPGAAALSPVARVEAGGDPDAMGSAMAAATNSMARMVDALRRGESFRIGGLSDYYYRQFSRLRLGEIGFDLDEAWSEASGGRGYEKAVPLPVEFALGRCRVTGEYAIQRTEAGRAGVLSLEVFSAADGKPLASVSRPADGTPDFAAAEWTVDGAPSRRLELRFRSPERLQVRLRNLEVQWDLEAVARAEQRHLLLAQAEHLDDAGRRGEVRSILEQVDGADATGLDRVRIARLAFAVGGDEAEKGAAPRLEAARTLLALAPSHAGALRVAAQADSAAGKRWEELDLPEPKRTPVFQPYLKLVGLKVGGNILSGVLEACRDDVPPLALCLETRSRGRWKRLGETLPLVTAARPLYRGERVRFDLPLEAPGGRWRVLSEIGLGVESRVPWFPGRLAVSGDGGAGRVTLDTLVGSPSQR